MFARDKSSAPARKPERRSGLRIAVSPRRVMKIAIGKVKATIFRVWDGGAESICV
jgi:hypothetical protein